MDLNTTADSGQPSPGNAGKESSHLDNAITAALGALDEKPSLSKALTKEPEQPTTEAGEVPAAESAGEDRDSEHATVSDSTAKPNKPQGEKDEKAPETGPKSSEAPKHWAADDKQAFAGLPDGAKAIVLKLSKNLEAGFTRKSQELSDKGKFADAVRGLFEDSDREQLVRSGLDEVGGVRYLLSLQRFATQHPVDYLKWAMRTLGVPPDRLGLSQTSPTATPQEPSDNMDEILRDPVVKQLQAELQDIKGKLTERERQEIEHRRSLIASSVNSIQSQIGQFRSAIDENGQLRYPHFDAVQRPMGALMETDPDLMSMPDGAEKLDKAYHMAVWARPDLRQTFLDERTAHERMEVEKRAAAEKAKRATSVKGATSLATSKPKASTLDDALMRSMDKLGL